MKSSKNALVIVLSHVSKDPRVLREIDWLAGEGWTVDTLGLGELDLPTVRSHFSLAPQRPWSTTKVGRAAMHALLPNRAKFRLMAQSRFPAEVATRVARGDYDLILFNDIELTPWIADTTVFTPAARRAHIHLDVHEFFAPRLPPGSALRFRVESYYQWTRSFIPNAAFTSRTVVANGIADLYVDEFGIEKPRVVRNAPPRESQIPSPVDADRINLLHHGTTDWRRGFRDMVDAMRTVDERFHLTFMLAGSPAIIAELKAYAAEVADRVTFVPPAAVAELSTVVNAYDLEIMFYRPASMNLLNALPNKLFEAVQGRLGLVIGESPMMAEIVREYGNGLIVSGWTAADLAAGINTLTADDVTAMKAASHRAAEHLSAEHEREEFLRAIAGA